MILVTWICLLVSPRTTCERSAQAMADCEGIHLWDVTGPLLTACLDLVGETTDDWSWKCLESYWIACREGKKFRMNGGLLLVFLQMWFEEVLDQLPQCLMLCVSTTKLECLAVRSS